MPSSKEFTMMFQLSATTSAQFQSAFSGAQSQISQLQSKIDGLNKLQGNINAYQKQQSAVDKTRSRLDLLRQQHANLRTEMLSSNNVSADMQNKLMESQYRIDQTSQSLERQTERLNAMGNALNEAGIDTNNLGEESQRLTDEMGQLRQEQDEVADSAQQFGQNMGNAVSAMEQALISSGIVDGLKAIGEALYDCAQASIEYESAMAGVKRTVGGSDQFIGDLGTRFKELSTEIPISATELAGIATTAGQLGIAQENVESFTTVMAQLATTTDLSADDAATMLAQFANITGTTDYERLGSTIAELGDATATTASKVVEMSQGMAASASLAGMQETDILAIAAAVGSLGIEAQAGSTAMSTLISTLYKAVETGDGLEDFASVANMSAEQFKEAWAENAVGAMDAFIQGLNDTERNGKSAIVILDELGITNVRQTKAILGLASAGDLLSNTITQANNAWESNTALGDKAAIMYETTESKMTMMQNAANNVKVAVGDALTPAIGAVADAATSILQPISEFIAKNPALVQGITAAVGVLGGATAAILGVSAAIKVVSAAAALLTSAIPGLPVILGIVAGVAALTGVVVGLSSAFGEAGQSFEELDHDYDKMIDEIKHQQEISDMCDEYMQLEEQLGNVGDEMEGLTGSGGTASVTVSATADATLQSEDFMSEDDKGITLDAEQTATLLKSGFFEEGQLQDNGDGTVTLTAEQTRALMMSGFFMAGEVTNNGDGTITITAEQAKNLETMGFFKEGELTGDGTAEVTLTAEQVAALEAKGFMLNGEDSITLTAEQKAELEAAGFMVDGDSVVPITGEVDDSSLLSGEDFAGDDMSVDVTPELKLEEINGQLAQLSTKLSGAKSDLDAAQATLDTLQSDYDELELKFYATNEESEKSALRAEMEELSTQITTQKGKVSSLQTTYDSLNEEYTATQTTASELTAQYERQQELRQALIDQSGGLITATAGETEQLNAQVGALKAIAEAKASDLRSKAYDNIIAQSGKYVESLQSEEESVAMLDKANATYAASAQLMGTDLGELQARLQSAQAKLVELREAGADWDSSEVQAYASEFETLYNLMKSSSENTYFGSWDDLSTTMAYLDTGVINLNTDTTDFETRLKAMADEAANYAEAVTNADGTQQEFLNNLVSGVQDGGMSLEYLEGILTEQFASYENGGELVKEAMDYVREQVEGTADATEDMTDGMSEGMEGVADSASEMNESFDSVKTKLEELNTAYKEAYESALSSIDGQFDLFEKVEPVGPSKQYVNTGDNSMREGLESQAKFMEEYTDNLQKAQELGVNTDLLGELADGSVESAETLKRLVSESTTPEDIEALNASYELAQQKKEELATSIAELQTNFTTEMQTMEEQMATSIANMDKSAEATTSAQNTLSALVTEAQNMESPVYQAFKRVADEISRALATVTVPEIPLPTPGGGGGTGGGTGGNVGGDASGTSNAARGFAMVGELGPELVWFGGGEQVFTAAQTSAMETSAEDLTAADAGAVGISINFAPQYNIGGNASAAEVRAALAEHDNELIAQLEEILGDIEADRTRRAYV